MSTVNRRIDRLLHRAQQHRMNLHRIWAVFGRFRNRLKLAGLGIVTDRHAQTGGLKVTTQNFFFLWRGTFVNAKQASVFALCNKVSTAHIGSQHGFLNHPMGDVASTGDNFFDTTVFVTNDLRLGGLEVHRASLFAGLLKRLKHPMKIEQIANALFAFEGFRPTGVTQNRSNFGVSKAGMAPHHGRIKLVSLNLPLEAHKHVTHHAQALDLRLQRAQAIRELFRQHGNHTAREIHAGCAVIRVNVNGRTRLYIMTDIGNGDQQTPAFGCRLATALGGRFTVNRIIKITRVFAINRDQWNVR